MSKTIHLDRVVLNRHSQDVANGTKHWKVFFMEEEGSSVSLMLAGDEAETEHVRFRFPISSFVVRQSDLHP